VPEKNRLSMDRDAVASMQDNLGREEPLIFASYGVIGAIVLLGGSGLLADQFLGTAPWGLLAGLLVGVVLGFYQLARHVRR
jgi:F0F1-type ATP synthase assembly protein I